MSDTPVPPRQPKQFLGRAFMEPPPRSKIRDDAAALGAVGTLPPPLPGAPVAASAPEATDAPRARVVTEREQQFRR